MNTTAVKGLSKSTEVKQILIGDIFIKENPAELNELMHNIQCEKFEVVKTFIAVGNQLSKCRREIHKHLRVNYKKAIEETKKNAGVEALELWAAADMFNGEQYDDYIEYKSAYEYLEKVLSCLNKDIDAVEHRIDIFLAVR